MSIFSKMKEEADIFTSASLHLGGNTPGEREGLAPRCHGSPPARAGRCAPLTAAPRRDRPRAACRSPEGCDAERRRPRPAPRTQPAGDMAPDPAAFGMAAFSPGSASTSISRRWGFGVTVFLGLKLSARGRVSLEDFERAVSAIPEVQSVHLVLGLYDYRLRVVARDLADFERILRRRIMTLPGVGELESNVPPLRRAAPRPALAPAHGPLSRAGAGAGANRGGCFRSRARPALPGGVLPCPRGSRVMVGSRIWRAISRRQGA